MTIPSQTILIVDDSPADRETLEGVLSGEGYTLVFAEDGVQALSTAAATHPDVILLDVMMPGMDGFEVCRRLRQLDDVAEIPVIMVTALDDRDSRIKGVQAGADEFVTKPYDRTELRARVGTVTRLNRYRKLVEEREKVDQLVRLSPDGILVVDEHGQIQIVNPAARALFRVDDGDLRGRSLWDFVHGDGVDKFRTFVSAVLRDQTPSSHYETRFKRQDGQEVPADVAAGYCMWDGIPSCELIIRDVTERKRLEAELQRHQRLEALGRMARSVAHDFGNYLTSVILNAEMLAEEVEAGSESHAAVTDIVQVAKKADELTRQLLMFACGKETKTQVLDLNKVMVELEPVLAHMLGKQVTLKLMPDASPTHVRTDKTQIEQVLVNLAVNARDAMSSTGTVTVATYSVARTATVPNAESYVQLTVQDDGAGMDSDTRARIFEPFFTTKGEGKGTGLGLATVYGIVRQHHGHITVESEPEHGTTFHILLPRAQGDPSETSFLQ